MTRRRVSPSPPLWLAAALSMAAAVALAPAVRWIDARTQWTLLGFGAEGARNLLGALTSSLLTFIVFAFSILLLAAQIVTGQLTPRILARLFENRLTKATVSAFVFSWVYALTALGRVQERVPQLPVALAILFSLASVVLFLFLVQSDVKMLRPITILTRVALDTRAVIEGVYPRPYTDEGAGPEVLRPNAGSARVAVRHRGRSAVLLSFDRDRLLRLASRAGCSIELVPQVGDFVPSGETLFLVRGTGAATVREADLVRSVALGPERTLEQDPSFGFRIIVDIASKALSPAINDPTTAVLAIDQLQPLLLLLAWRALDTGLERDADGRPALIFRTPDWEDFVALAATEIRLYGAGSPQVMRRLQAMFEHLLRTVPPGRAAPIEREMALLVRTVERSFADPEERAFALDHDLQGLGSRTHRR